jgi:GNAT superfamily N-acetyltransferase
VNKPVIAPPDVTIRLARRGEAPALTELCTRSKAYWGYDAAFMAAAARTIEIRERNIRAKRVLVAVSDFNASRESGAPPLLGVAAVLPMDSRGTFDLSHLFVAPEAFGEGIGTALFDAAMQLAAAQGGRRLSILSDPNAAGFYEKLGATRRGEAPSDAVPHRMLPLFEIDITHQSLT